MSDRSMPSSFDDNSEYQETGWRKVSRKIKEEPLIPLGTALTCLALYNAWRAMRRGDHEGVQRMFRARIGAQAFTVIAMVAGGAYYGADREKRKELIKLEATTRAEERHQKWLKELEVRDEEDKVLKEAIRRKRERVESRKAEREAEGENRVAEAGKEIGEKTEEVAERVGEGVVKAEGKVVDALKESGSWFGSGKKGEKIAREEAADAGTEASPKK
ncbi:mitochondrial hypoxia responsive domain-containing protein [Xylariaceae sp. FL1272]|nr:mitochondrial hypoxia responsive domain-containing protein [Xylariaceae sp. FL1272]